MVCPSFFGFDVDHIATSISRQGILIQAIPIWGLYPLNRADYNPHTILMKYGGSIMILFDKLWSTMEERGVSTYQLREKCDLDSKTIRRLRANQNVETKTLDKLCVALSCRLEDIAEYVTDRTEG